MKRRRKLRRWVKAVLVIAAGVIMATGMTSCMVSAHYQTLERIGQ